MTTYTKAVIEANQRYIRRLYGSDKKFYNDVLRHADIYRSEYPRSRADSYNVIYFMVKECLGNFPIYSAERERYLAKTIPGYNPARMRYKDGSLRSDKVDETFARLMARDGAKICDRIDMDRFLSGKDPKLW